MQTTFSPRKWTLDTLTPDSLEELTAFQGRPCLSLFQTTHRSHPDNQQDPIRFGHLLKSLETSLEHQSPDTVKALLAPLQDLAQARDFWAHTLDGLAVLRAPDFFRIYLLPRAVPDLALVADSFHTKPLRHFLQSVERYQVLCLSLNKLQLFEGNRHGLEAISLSPQVPQNISEPMGSTHTEPHSTVSSYGGIGTGHSAMHHGQGGKKDEMDTDTARFFRAVDRAVLEHHSQPSGLPLMLAALPEHHHLFHAISHNPYLMSNGLMTNPDSLDHKELVQRAWEVVTLENQAQHSLWSDAYAATLSQGLGSESLPDVAHAAAAGRVATLLIEANRQEPGRIDVATGRIDYAELDHPRVDDVLDDLGALVEKLGGQVHVLPAERMPTRTGLAANFAIKNA